MSTPIYRAPLAEFIATTLFVWVGCGTAVSTQSIQAFSEGASLNDNTFHVSVSLAFGLAISVLAYSIAHISGGHINPAVTLAFVLSGDLCIVDGLSYIAAQCLGATLGAALIWGSMDASALTDKGDHPPFDVGMNVVNPNLSAGSGFLAEGMGTFLLVWTVLMTAANKKSIAANIAPIAIGWAVLLAHLVLVPLTGCGINPARSLGPMLMVIFAGEKASFNGWWVYYTAPFVGSALAFVVCKYVFCSFDDDDEATEDNSQTKKEGAKELSEETDA